MSGTIVPVEQLHAHLGDSSWVAVDCRHLLADHSAGRKMYDAGHIPGAFFARVEDDLSGEKTGANGRHPMPDAQRFAAFLRELGVTPDTQIVAYDAGGDMFAARFWFLARYIGHTAVAVLDGGYAAWTAAGYPLETHEPERPRNGTITPRVQTGLAVDAAGVQRSLQNNTFTLIDARGADRFAGQNETIDPVAGHIPGALNRPFKENFDAAGRFKAAPQLRTEFEALGIAPERIVHQCGSGVSAAVNMLAMEIAGMNGTRLYPGSWSEWCADRSRPMVTP